MIVSANGVSPGEGLRLADVHVYYGQHLVVRNVSLSLPDGAALAVIGRNGVGKTTLVRAIIRGFGVRVAGSITLDGRELTRLRTEQIVRLGISLVPSDRRILPMSVADNLRIACLKAEGWSDRAEALLEYFPFLKGRWKQRGDTLSGGEQQALAVVRGLMRSPRYLVLDEPVEGLAPRAVAGLVDGLHAIRQETGVTLLVVERNQLVLRELTDNVVVMARGEVVYQGKTGQLLDNRDLVESLLSVQSDVAGQ
jgi:branched-chain amino acid transport system ATP-binding protein